MPINNINTLVSKDILSYLGSSDYISYFYNEALANLGQRNTELNQIEYKTFTIKDLLIERGVSESDIPVDIYIENYNDNINLNKTKFRFNVEELNDTINNNNYKTIIYNSKINIIKALFNTIKKELDDENGNFTKQQQLHIPVEYEFEYIYDATNKTHIYGSNKNIPITIIPPNNELLLRLRESNNSLYIINDRQSHIQINVYNYSVGEYIQTLYLYDIVAERKFIYPYILDNYWYINGLNTKIPAKSQDALNLNIILGYNDILHGSLQILSGLNSNIYSTFVSQPVSCYIKSHNYNYTFRITNYVPNLRTYINNSEFGDADWSLGLNEVNSVSYSEYITYRVLANSTLIIMAKVNECIDNTDVHKNEILAEYGDGYITTMWNYNKEENEWQYISIDTDNKGQRIALDFNTITNFTNLVNAGLAKLKQIEPDNFLFTYLIFDSAVDSVKQSTDTNGIFPVLQNFKAKDYASISNNQYTNDLNFNIRYASGYNKNGALIDSVIYNGNNHYMSINNSQIVTNSIYSITQNGETTNYREYIPNYNVPVFDQSEILIKDSNIMNRQNILSFDNSGKVYYSYIGSSFNDIDKSILHIGSSNYNINIGTQTLLNTNQRSQFNKQNLLSVDFNNTYFRGNTNVEGNLTVNNIYHNKLSWEIITIDDSVIRTTNIVPKFKYNKKDANIYNIINLSTVENDLLSLPQDNTNSLYLYTNIILKQTINDTDYYYKHGDLLYLPNFLRYIGLTDLNQLTITSETNDIIYHDNNPLYLVTNSNKLSNYININSSLNGISLNLIGLSNNFFTANPIDLIHITDQNGSQTLIINEQQTNKLQSIWRLPTNI